MDDAVPDNGGTPVFATDSRTITALGERVAAVETKVTFLQSVVDKISGNIHGINQELMKIQIMSSRNSDSLDTIKATVVERGVQITEFRSWVSAEFAATSARQEARDIKLTNAISELSEKRFLLEGAWGATIRISAAFVASISILGVLARLLGVIK